MHNSSIYSVSNKITAVIIITVNMIIIIVVSAILGVYAHLRIIRY